MFADARPTLPVLLILPGAMLRAGRLSMPCTASAMTDMEGSTATGPPRAEMLRVTASRANGSAGRAPEATCSNRMEAMGEGNARDVGTRCSSLPEELLAPGARTAVGCEAGRGSSAIAQNASTSLQKAIRKKPRLLRK